jgi:hypothetical protein
MKRILVTILAALALATGCNDNNKPTDHGNGTPTPVGSSATSAGGRVAADVRGTFRMVGGPYPGISRPLQGTITVHENTRDGKVVQTVTTDKHGKFATFLPPGRYWFVGTSRHITGMGCPNVHAVTVTAAATAHVQVVCAIP